MLAIETMADETKPDTDFWDRLGADSQVAAHVTGVTWNGFVTRLDPDHVEMSLHSTECPEHEFSAWIGRAHVPNETFSFLGVGVCFSLVFAYDSEGRSFIDIVPQNAHQA